jgi:hypothetical protein
VASGGLNGSTQSLAMSALALFFERTTSFAPNRGCFIVVFAPSVDDHGPPIVERSVSVRPKDLSDQSFDHDYPFKLLRVREGTGCPIDGWVAAYFSPC